MKMASAKKLIITFVAMAVSTLPAFANHLTTATGNASCTQYTISVTGADLYYPTANVSYKVVLTPKSGTPIIVTNSFTVIRGGGGNFTGMTTQPWPSKLKINSNYTISGAARLDVPLGNTIPIVFSPATLNCKVVAGSCQAASSLSVLAQGKTVTGYVPNGNWSSSSTGVQVVPIEPVGSPSSIATPNIVNSCGSNSVTGETVCTANNTDVYLIKGTTLNTTLSSGADAYASFSGGYCYTCGVAMNPNNNEAVVTIGLSGAPSGSGLQVLDLSTNTFAAPIPAANEVSEDVVWDPVRNYILSPDESGTYDLFQTNSAITEYGNSFGVDGDSAAEDCSTGIALSSIEMYPQYSGNPAQIYITDLTQAVFSSSTWSAPGQVVSFPEFTDFSYGTDGIAVAGGSPASHLGIVTGEYGGNAFGVLELPSTSGTGTPSFVDYAAAVLPNTPDGNAWSDGLDPHTITAYVSPNNGKAYGVMANFNGSVPTYLAVVDLKALLSAPRLTGTHTVDPTYNLITNGVLVYIAVQ